MSLREAAQMALDVLENYGGYGGGNDAIAAEKALRAALAEPAAPAEYEAAPNGRRSAVLTAMMNARTRAEAALAEQPCSCGEPSAFGVVHLKNGPCYVLSKLETAAPTPYTEADCLAAEKKWSAPAAPTVVEPVAWASPSVIPLREGQNNHPCVLTDTRCAANTVPLYATPPRAPLSDEEIYKIGNTTRGQQGGWNIAFARAIEKAHGIGEPRNE